MGTNDGLARLTVVHRPSRRPPVKVRLRLGERGRGGTCHRWDEAGRLSVSWLERAWGRSVGRSRRGVDVRVGRQDRSPTAPRLLLNRRLGTESAVHARRSRGRSPLAAPRGSEASASAHALELEIGQRLGERIVLLLGRRTVRSSIGCGLDAGRHGLTSLGVRVGRRSSVRLLLRRGSRRCHRRVLGLSRSRVAVGRGGRAGLVLVIGRRGLLVRRPVLLLNRLGRGRGRRGLDWVLRRGRRRRKLRLSRYGGRSGSRDRSLNRDDRRRRRSWGRSGSLAGRLSRRLGWWRSRPVGLSRKVGQSIRWLGRVRLAGSIAHERRRI